MLFYLLMKYYEMYNIQLDNSNIFKKDWKKLNQDMIYKKKIKSMLQMFAVNPFSERWNIKKMFPKSSNKSRLRIWEYRIIYSIDDGNKIILIHRIALRKEVYK